jgi:hypothetical protein
MLQIRFQRFIADNCAGRTGAQKSNARWSAGLAPSLAPRELFLVQHQQLASMLFAKPLEPLEAEAYHPVLVGDYQVRHLSRLDADYSDDKAIHFTEDGLRHFTEEERNRLTQVHQQPGEMPRSPASSSILRPLSLPWRMWRLF